MSSIDLPAGLLGDDAWPDELARAWSVLEPQAATLGWATVDLDRAEADLWRRLGGPPARTPRRATDDGHDELLGASARIVHLPGSDPIVLLEPSTEGPLAAALARHGEGLLAAYVAAAPGAPDRIRGGGLLLSRPAAGPFGQQRRVLAGLRDGPFLLLIDGETAQ